MKSDVQNEVLYYAIIILLAHVLHDLLQPKNLISIRDEVSSIGHDKPVFQVA